MASKFSKHRAAESSAKGRSTRIRDIRTAAKKYFDFEELRPGQEEPIGSLLAGKDTLVVMPTGAGKSAIYQVGGAMRQGPVLIISPLIALQKDQVDWIEASKNGFEAAVINSTLAAGELRDALEKIASGNLKFVFMAPEQTGKQEVLEALRNANLSIAVIDEAHCISQWGHDFRPDYLRLGKVIETLGHPVTLALTATASAAVRQEIIERLGMRKPRVFIGGFDRPNIRLRVDHFEEEQDKRAAITHQIRWAGKPGIVYTATRREAEEIMHDLEEEGMSTLFYHGGLKASERDEIQDRFMAGEAEVIIATNAFGMGIDKSDIRFVYHYDAPDSLDAYYQEIGRAGRDGERAEAVLFYRKQDIGAQAFHTGAGKVDEHELALVTRVLAQNRRAMNAEAIAGIVNLSERKLQSILQQLEDAGVVSASSKGEVKLVNSTALEGASERVIENQEERRQANRERLELMREYAETTGCRRELLLRYFGEVFDGPCGNCDNCEARDPQGAVDPNVGTRREVA
jgi:ATP-dependent DNA helicase RecQ